jgi:hypothetical protein
VTPNCCSNGLRLWRRLRTASWIRPHTHRLNRHRRRTTDTADFLSLMELFQACAEGRADATGPRISITQLKATRSA